MALLNRNSSIRPGMGSLSRQNSGIRMNGSPGMAMASGKHLAAKEKEKEEGHIDVGGKNPPAYKLESIQACQLIAYIYECKLKEALEDHNEINFYECEPLLEFAKEVGWLNPLSFYLF